MNRKSIIYILLIVILSMLLVSCIETKSEDTILFENVDSIEIVFDEDNKVTYTPKENKREIEKFINKFNEGKSFGSIEGDTEDTKVTINLKDGTSIAIQQ